MVRDERDLEPRQAFAPIAVEARRGRSRKR